MALEVYSPPTTAVIHETTVDIGNVRSFPKVIKLTQGDKSLPVIAIKLLNSGEPYKVPETATDARLNFLKGDGKAVINSALGVSEDRHTVYVEATEQTCAASGRGQAILQIMIGEQAAGTGVFIIDVAPNPTTDASLSDTEIGVLQGLVDEANSAKTDAKQSASNASKSATEAQASADEASDSATLAGQHKTDAESAKNSAEQFANKAEQEATTAEQARDTAEEYMEKAQASSAVSNSSYYIGDDGMLHLSFNSDGLGKKDIDQTLLDLQSTIESLSKTVTDQASEITELQGDVETNTSSINGINTAMNDYFMHIEQPRQGIEQITCNPTWTGILQNEINHDFATGGYYLVILNGLRIKFDNPTGNLAFGIAIDGKVDVIPLSYGQPETVGEICIPVIALVNIPKGNHNLNIMVRNEQAQAVSSIQGWTISNLIIMKV